MFSSLLSWNIIRNLTSCANFRLFTDPNTQILYACDSCGDKFLDATSLAQHVRIHTAQALVMFQADSDFYQYTAATPAGEGDDAAAATWQPAPEHVMQDGELIFRPDEEERKAKGLDGELQEEQGSETIIHVEEAVEVEETTSEQPTDERDEEGKEDDIKCEGQG